MSFEASSDTKERIRRAIDIVELVGGYLSLRREGRAYKALCPWHNDTRPSLQVNPERQSYKCWVCDIGGDVFHFVMKMEGITFPEALQLLADKAGIPLERGKPASGQPPAVDKRQLFRLVQWAEARFQRCLLNDPEAATARQYLADRKITPESIERFHVGFAPDRWDWLLTEAQAANYLPRDLEAAGLAVPRREGGGHYDRFRGRIMFSIRDGQARPAGFGGRILPGATDAEAAKYINSPETVLFSKSQLLYGLDQARQEIRRSQVAVVMEGYTDCIVAHQCGLANAVAVLGTALGERHLRALRQIDERVRVVLVLDGDEAGRKRTNEVLAMFVTNNIDVRVLTLSGELDPCDYLLARGVEDFQQQVRTAPDALAHAVHYWTEGIDKSRDVHAASDVLERLLRVVAQAPRLRSDTTTDDRLRELKILERLAFEFRVPEQELRNRLTGLRRSAMRVRDRRAATVGSPGEATASPGSDSVAEKPVDPWERELVELLVQWPAGIEQVSRVLHPDDLAPGPCRVILDEMCRCHDSGECPTWEDLLASLGNTEYGTFLVDLDERGRAKSIEAVAPRLAACLTSLTARRERLEYQAGVAALRAGALDELQGRQLLEQIIQKERTRQGISTPTDG